MLLNRRQGLPPTGAAGDWLEWYRGLEKPARPSWPPTGRGAGCRSRPGRRSHGGRQALARPQGAPVLAAAEARLPDIARRGELSTAAGAAGQGRQMPGAPLHLEAAYAPCPMHQGMHAPIIRPRPGRSRSAAPEARTGGRRAAAGAGLCGRNLEHHARSGRRGPGPRPWKSPCVDSSQALLHSGRAPLEQCRPGRSVIYSLSGKTMHVGWPDSKLPAQGTSV